MKKIKIIDYFAGNIFSVTKALEHMGCDVKLAVRAQDIEDADYLVLPGVGAFGDGMKSLEKRGLVGAVKKFAGKGRPFLGICLGMQLLFDSSEEFGSHQGLGVIPGAVKKLPTGLKLKIPNIGWHSLAVPEGRPSSFWDHSILSGVPVESDFYFIHSFAVYPTQAEHWLARTVYGDHWFCSAARKDNMIGCQFHPEKSGADGLKILENFIQL